MYKINYFGKQSMQSEIFLICMHLKRLRTASLRYVIFKRNGPRVYLPFEDS